MKPKRIPTRLYEWRRFREDRRLDESLLDPQGRHAYWCGLAEHCQRDSMISLLEESLSLEGDVIECGVYRGTTLMRIARTVREFAPGKSLFGLDSFAGFPEEGIVAADIGPHRFMRSVRKKFRFCHDTPGRLRSRFQHFGIRGEIVSGFFEDTLPRFAAHRFCFIHLDCDLYASYRECLTALYEQLTPGGVVVFDECDSQTWPGSRRAIKEFLAGRDETVQLCLDRDKPAFYVRRPCEMRTSAAA